MASIIFKTMDELRKLNDDKTFYYVQSTIAQLCVK